MMTAEFAFVGLFIFWRDLQDNPLECVIWISVMKYYFEP